MEQFLKSASGEEKADFFDLVRRGNIGISATYLNGTDLTDVKMLNHKTAAMQEIFTARGLPVRVAMNDWRGNGVGSTPYAVKHYKEALRLSHICDCLEKKTGTRNALLYAEHTWGHSATVSNPYDTMVTNLDIRKTSNASRAHEAAAMRKSEQCHLMGDILRYYNSSGEVKAVSTSGVRGVYLPLSLNLCGGWRKMIWGR